MNARKMMIFSNLLLLHPQHKPPHKLDLTHFESNHKFMKRFPENKRAFKKVVHYSDEAQI